MPNPGRPPASQQTKKPSGNGGGAWSSPPGTKPKPTKPAPKPIGQLSVTEQQKRLKAAGFNVSVDGIEGPQTQMARKALINGVSASYWNKVWLKNHPPSAAGQSGATLPDSSGSSGPPPTTESTASTPTVTTDSGGTKPVVPASTQLNLIDPTKYANEAANAEFAGPLAGANYNLKYAERALPETLKDLTGWNQQITNTFNKYDSGAGYQAGIDEAQGNAANVANLFGESTHGESQAQNAGNLGMLQGLQGNQRGFQDIMQSVLGAQGRDYARRATREGKVDITKAQTELAGLRSQKGAARSKYLFDATATRTNQEQAQAALDQAAALAPYEQATAAANATVATIEAQNAPAIAQAKLKQSALELKAVMAKIQADADKSSGKINWNDASVVDNVSNGAISGSIGPKGGLVLRPDLALQNILVTAQGAGAPPSVVQAAIAKLVRALNISHGKKNWSRWKWNGKTFVLGPAPKK